MRGRRDSDGATGKWSRSDWWGPVVDASDAQALARFYRDLLDWELVVDEPGHCILHPRDGGVTYLATQTAAGYVRPVWPNAEGQQQMMMHLDFEVSELAEAVAHAVELGATLPDFQPQDDVRVLLDPDGHPFCLYLGG